MHRGSRVFKRAKRAEDAMTAAVEIFNSPLITFKSETCIILIVTAWTYLCQAYCLQNHIDTRIPDTSERRQKYQRFSDGDYKQKSLKDMLPLCTDFLKLGVRNNLLFLIEIRNKIQHSSSAEVDMILAPKIQANVLNFQEALKEFSDGLLDISEALPLALQCSELSFGQIDDLLTSKSVDQKLRTFIIDFENKLSNEERMDMAYEAHVKLDVQNKDRGKNLHSFTVAKPGEEVPSGDGMIIKKEVEKQKYRPSEIVKIMQNKGFSDFTMYKHTELWKAENAKNPGLGYGVQVSSQWYWYQKWIDEKVRPFCENGYKLPVDKNH